MTELAWTFAVLALGATLYIGYRFGRFVERIKRKS